MTWYDWFCYYIGLDRDKPTPNISTMLARQKERLSWLWWLGVILTIVFTLVMLGFQFWLLFHIIFYKPAKTLAKALWARRKALWHWR